MDMDFSILRTSGRANAAVTGEFVRELVPEDLKALRAEKGSRPSALQRLSHRHHNLARRLAEGMAPGDAAAMCGYVPSRVSILQGDPAFSELVEFYRREVAEQYRDLHQQLSEIAGEAAEELLDRLEEAPKDIPLGQIVELVKLGADRTGFGPQSSNVNVNFNIGSADRLKQARERVQARRIEGEAKRISG